MILNEWALAFGYQTDRRDKEVPIVLNRERRSLSLAAVVSLFCLASFQMHTHAQNQQSPRPGLLPNGRMNVPFKSSHPQTHNVERLKDKVDLPDLPAYTGRAKFKGGFIEAAAKGGPRYEMTFEAQEPRSQVIDWYANVLRMYNWKTLNRSEGSIVGQHKNGHLCTVTAHRYVRKTGETCEFSVLFQVANN